ncbi:hypothetical protein SAMN05421503_1084 [Terribacillus aidingensis]|uniref:Uncharacterized protein n=1 Tax=Terribacillus aidingensis TaxID=586416 RepID=A0A285N8Z8_9BACI|nr:hypothetical protein SAMN05421503_1084 [Terribacillus aidingensis]
MAILAFRTGSVCETSSAYLRIFQAPERYAPGLFNVDKLLLPLHQELESMNMMKEENEYAFIQFNKNNHNCSNGSD